MVSQGGIGPWKLDQDRASACLYVVAVRNRGGDVDEEGFDHRTAFMIGKISEIVQAGHRHVIAFSEYATFDIPNAWDGSRNPVAYTNLDKLKIDPATLEWRKLPGSSPFNV
ncbi:hypothetical protein J7E62_20680 [Variovorax paradoxus]|nr:hypothetical protein [Variovorax paradoxus]